MKKIVLLALLLACLAMSPVSAQPCYDGGTGINISVGVGVPNVYYQPGYTYIPAGVYAPVPGYAYPTVAYPPPYPYVYPATPYPYSYGPGVVYNGPYANRYVNGRLRPGVRVNVGFPVR